MLWDFKISFYVNSNVDKLFITVGVIVRRNDGRWMSGGPGRVVDGGCADSILQFLGSKGEATGSSVAGR
jgi:hypothetical protein